MGTTKQGVTHCPLLAEGVGLPEGFLQRVKGRRQAVAQLQPETDGGKKVSQRHRLICPSVRPSVSLSAFTWFAWRLCRFHCLWLLVSGWLALIGRCIAAG